MATAAEAGDSTKNLIAAINSLTRLAVAKDVPGTYEAARKTRDASNVYRESISDPLKSAEFVDLQHNLFKALKVYLATDSTKDDKIALVRCAVALTKWLAGPQPPQQPQVTEQAPTVPPPAAAGPPPKPELPPLADYYDEDVPAGIPMSPIVLRATRSSTEIDKAVKRGSVFCVMPPRDDAKTFFQGAAPPPEEAPPEDSGSAPGSGISRLERSGSVAAMRGRTLTVTRPMSTDSLMATRITKQAPSPSAAPAPGPLQASSSSTSVSSSTSSSTTAPLSARSAPSTPPGSPQPPRTANAPPPVLTARQAQADCLRAQWVSVEKTLGWYEGLLVLRTGGDLYVFKEALAPKPAVVMRLDKFSVIEFVRAGNGNALKIQAQGHKLVFRTNQGNEVLAWKALLEKTRPST